MDELRAAAIAVLVKAFKEPHDVPAHIVQAATAVVLTPAA